MHRAVLGWVLLAGLGLLACGGGQPGPTPGPAPVATAAPVFLDQSSAWPRKADFQRGFLHATAPFPSALFEGLRPTSWRLGDLNAIQDLGGRNIVITEVMSDLYFKKIGSSTFQPWENWDQFEAIYRDIVRDSDRLGVQVDYWEIANEVDSLIPAGTDEAGRAEAMARFQELNRRAIRAIRSVKPEAKIIGCSFSGWDTALATMYLDFIQSEHLQIDAFAWHMLALDPRDIQAQVDAFRNLMGQRGLALEIHINEFMGGQNHLVPGWNLAYLTRLFEARVTSYSRACWQRPGFPERTSECLSGLDGLLTPDNRQLTKLGALYLATVAMAGDRLKAIPLGDGWSGLASYDSVAQNGSLLVGTYSCGRQGLWCRFSDEQAADEQVGIPPLKLPMVSAAYAGRQIQISKVVLENRNLDAAYVPSAETTEYATADSEGRFPILLELKDGEVAVIRFSLRPDVAAKAGSWSKAGSTRSHNQAAPGLRARPFFKMPRLAPAGGRSVRLNPHGR